MIHPSRHDMSALHETFVFLSKKFPRHRKKTASTPVENNVPPGADTYIID